MGFGVNNFDDFVLLFNHFAGFLQWNQGYRGTAVPLQVHSFFVGNVPVSYIGM